MEKLLKKIPVPIGGLILALAATGNLVLSYGAVYRNIFGLLSGLLLLLFIIKLFTDFRGVSEQLQSPLLLSIGATFTMALMILSTYIKPYLPGLAFGVWGLGLLLHACLIAVFTVKYIFRFDIKKVFPSYFIVYVGIAAASITAPVFGQSALGRGIFWFGFVMYLCLLPVVLYRIFITKGIPEPALPTITICAAPASLCLVGYLASFQAKSMAMVYLLGALSLMMFLGVLIYLPRLLKLKFYPSYSSFTFPLVISAIAMKQANGFLLKAGSGIAMLKYIAAFEAILAVAMVLYVLCRYMIFLFVQGKPAAGANAKSA